MRRYKDATTHAVRNVIEPYLAEAGFTRFKSKDFCRLRGDFFDHVYFGFGRWGSDSLYVYYSLHLLTDPITSKNTYHAGGRLSGRWFPQDHEKACLAAADICSAIQEQALPWFAEMNCVEKYQGVWYENGAAIAFSEIARGDYVRARLFLEDYVSDKSDLIYSSGYPGCRDYEYSTSSYGVRPHISQIRGLPFPKIFFREMGVMTLLVAALFHHRCFGFYAYINCEIT